jgi:protein strawberry notch
MGLPLIHGTQELVDELVQRLKAGESLDNLKLKRLADKFFGGIRALGIYTSRDSYDALETAVNKFLLETVAARSELPVLETLRELRDILGRLPGQSSRTTEQIEFQQFSTPPTIAFIASRLADLQPGDVALEPSGGTGSLAIWARLPNVKVICNDINARRRCLLQEILGFDTFGVDAEMIDDVLPGEIAPTVVLMNPPFTGTGGRVVVHRNKYGLLHIDTALRRLREGGRLVAIASEAVSFSRPGSTGWWQQIAMKYAIRANFGLSGSLAACDHLKTLGLLLP